MSVMRKDSDMVMVTMAALPPTRIGLSSETKDRSPYKTPSSGIFSSFSAMVSHVSGAPSRLVVVRRRLNIIYPIEWSPSGTVRGVRRIMYD